jgi:hypothetical protein
MAESSPEYRALSSSFEEEPQMPRHTIGTTDAAPLLGGAGVDSSREDRSTAGLAAPSESDATRGAGGRRRSSLAHALARQNSAQRVQHAGRVANHPLAPPRATLGKTICSTMLAMVLILCIIIAFVEDGYDLENIKEPCRSQLEPIGLWLKVLIIFPVVDIVPPWIAYCCSPERVQRLRRLIEACACCNFLGRMGWLILGTSWIWSKDCDLTQTEGLTDQPMVYQVARFVVIMSWTAFAIVLAICCCMLPCLLYFMSQEDFAEQLARLQPGHVDAADEETIEHIAKGIYSVPAEPGGMGKLRVSELNYEADVEKGAAIDCIGLVDYVSAFAHAFVHAFAPKLGGPLARWTWAAARPGRQTVSHSNGYPST